MSLLSTSHTFSFKRTKNILHTILLSICFVFANSAFATSNPSSSISQNTEVYLVTTDWIDSSSTLIFNPVSEKYFLSKTESSNNSLVFSQPFPNPDSDGDGIPDSVEDGSSYLSDLSIWLDANDAASITIDNYYTADEWRDKSGNERHVSNQVGDPQTGLRTINGLNVIDFTSSRMATSSIASWLNNTSYTIIAVTQFDNNTEAFMGTEGGGNNQIMHHGYMGSNWTLSQFGGGNGTSWSTSLKNPKISIFLASKGSSQSWVPLF